MLVNIKSTLYCSINVSCYEVSVLTTGQRPIIIPLMLTKPLQAAGTRVVLRSGLTVPLGGLMTVILHVWHSRRPWKAWEQGSLCVHMHSQKQN